MIFDCVFLHRDVLETITSLASPRRPPSRALRRACPLCHPSLPSHTTFGVFPNGGTAGLATDCSRPGTPASRGGAVPACRWQRTPRWSWATTAKAAMEMGVCLVGAAGQRRRRVCWREVVFTSWAADWCGRVALGHAGTQPLRNWSPRFVYPLYISQTWELKKVKSMRKI